MSFRACESNSQLLINGIMGMWPKLPEAQKPVSDKRGGLKGSVQHWLAVYPLEFEIPRFVVAGY